MQYWRDVSNEISISMAENSGSMANQWRNKREEGDSNYGGSMKKAIASTKAKNNQRKGMWRKRNGVVKRERKSSMKNGEKVKAAAKSGENEIALLAHIRKQWRKEAK